MMNVIFIAPPAAGKGTISKYLVDNFEYNHLSTGDLLRKIVKEDSELGRNIAALMSEGKFISDEIMFELIRKELVSLKDKPFILDGMPRNINQAEYLETMLKELGVDNYMVIHIDIAEEILEKRATGRRLCGNCGASYNIYFEGFKPLKENTCDKCNHELTKRTDDTAETIRVRYETYLNATAPLINFYENKGLLKTVDASKPQEEILKDVLTLLKGE